MMRRAVSMALVASVGCAPVASHRTHRDRVLGERTLTQPATDVAWRGSVQPEPDAIAIVLHGEQRCASVVERTLRRSTTLERSTDGASMGLLIGGGVALTAGGGFLLYDNRSGVDPAARRWDGGFPPDVGTAIGASFAVIGGIALVSAIVSGVRARDLDEGARDVVDTRPASDRLVACGPATTAGVPIVATFEQAGATKEIPLGSTRADGALTVPWTSVPDDALVGPSWPRTLGIVARPRGARVELGAVATEPGRKLRAARGFADATASPSPEAFEAFAAAFPEHRNDEPLRHARELRLGAARAALAAGDLVAARSAVDRMKALHADAPELAALEQELGSREATQQRDAAIANARAAVTAASAATATAESFGAASAAVAALRAGDPANPTVGELEAQLAAARAQRVTAALGEARSASRAGELATARQALELVAALAPTDGRLASARRDVDRLEARAHARDARQHEQAGDDDAALASLDAALALTPADRSLQRRKATIERRLARAAQARAAVAAAAAPPSLPPAHASAAPAAVASAAPSAAATAAGSPAASAPATTSATRPSVPASGTAPMAPRTTTPAATSASAVAKDSSSGASAAKQPTQASSTATRPQAPDPRRLPGSRRPAAAQALAGAHRRSSEPPRQPPRAASPSGAPTNKRAARPRARASVSYPLKRARGAGPFDLVDLPDGCMADFLSDTAGPLKVTLFCDQAVVEVEHAADTLTARCEASTCTQCSEGFESTLRLSQLRTGVITVSCTEPKP